MREFDLTLPMLTISAVILGSIAAYADMNTIDPPPPPPVPNNTPSEDQSPASPQTQSTTAVKLKLVLIIRSDNEQVNYKASLKEVIDNAEQANPNVEYYAVVYVPSGDDPTYNAMSSEAANRHLAEVVEAMKDMGVNEDKIRNGMEISSTRHEEIRIFTY